MFDNQCKDFYPTKKEIIKHFAFAIIYMLIFGSTVLGIFGFIGMKIGWLKFVDDTTFLEEGLPNFLNDKQLKLEHITKADINENGVSDYIIETIPVECGSCHAKPIYIIENGNVLFSYVGDDHSITNIKTVQYDHFLRISEPIRIEGEPLCCPSKYKETIISCPNLYGISNCGIESVNELTKIN